MEVKKLLWLLFAIKFCCGSEIPEFIGKLIEDLKVKEPSQVHDVVLISLGTGNKELTKEIAEVVLLKNVVMMPPTEIIIKNQRIRAASVMIIVSDVVDEVLLKNQIVLTQHSSYFVNTVKLIFITNRTISPQKVVSLFEFLLSLGSLNTMIILDEPEPRVCLYNFFNGRGYIKDIRVASTDISVLFADKLQDMHQYKYRLLLLEQLPQITLKNNGTEFTGIDVEIMKAIAASQNAGIEVPLGIKLLSNENIEVLRLNLLNQRADLTLNPIFTSPNFGYREYVITYDQNGYCAIVPIPLPLTFLHFLFTPFDELSWIFMIASVVACGVVWYILNSVWGETDSALYFLFGMLAVFLGQGIPFKTHHKGQTVLLQLCMLMMFIMGNLYQSLIISSMTWSRDGVRLKTFDELFDSGAKMLVADTFYRILKNSNEFDDALSRMEVLEVIEKENLIHDKKALIGRCDVLEYMTKVSVNFDLGSYFYMLPDSIMPFYDRLILARSNPFYEKLQMKQNFVFESGIRQHWKYILNQKQTAELNRNDLYITNEQYLLNMDDLYGVFYLLLGGCAISAFIFVLELIWSYLRHDVDYWKITKRIRTICRTKKRAMQIRKMQVHPMEV